MDSLQRQTHEQNKKEAFDGMRAYHQSEIAHKGHAVEMLKAILSASILVYGGLFGLVISQKIELDLIQMGAILTILINSAIAFSISKITNTKIKNDNIRYCIYYFEYRKERELLGLDADLLEAGFKSESQRINELNAKDSESSNETKCKSLSNSDSGHKYTQNILIHFASMITVVCVIGTLGLFALSFSK